MFISPLANWLRGGSDKDLTDRNIRFLYLEIVFASVLGGIIAYFNSAFAIRLGASKELVALLSSIPALVAAVASIPAARFYQTRVNRKLWLFGALFLVRAGYVVVALIPVIFPINPGMWLVIWLIVLNLPSTFFTNGFQALLAELVPERRRAFVFSRRSIIYSLGTVLISILAGQWLDRMPFPMNYQLMYGFGFVIVLGSHYYLNRLEIPPHQALTRRVKSADLGALVEPIEKAEFTPDIKRLLLNTLMYQIGLTLAGPLYNLYYIENLHATDGWIGLNGAAASIGVVVGYIIWERLLRRHNFLWGVRHASMLTWLFPVGIALIPNLNVIMFLNFLVNMVHPGFDLSCLNLLLKLSKPQHQTVYMSWYTTAINIAAFAAPIVGAWLFGLIGIQATFILAGIFRVAGCILFYLYPVQEPVPVNP